jgi:hypothetical protein
VNFSIPLYERIALRITALFSTWTFVTVQFAIIAAMLYLETAEKVDIAVSLWTLLFDNIILISTAIGAKRANQIQEYLIRMIQAEEITHDSIQNGIRKNEQVLEQIKTILTQYPHTAG